MESLRHLQMLLDGLQKKTDARTIMLLETTGHIICSAGSQLMTEPSVLASLIIGISTAGQQLGNIMGEKTSPTLLQEGNHLHLFSSFVSRNMILAVFSEKKEKLGFIRFKTKQYQAVLKALTDRFKAERKTLINPLSSVTEEELDRLLGF